MRVRWILVGRLQIDFRYNHQAPHSWGFLFVGWWVDLGVKKTLLIVLFISVGFSQELIRGVDTDIYGNVKISYYKETQNQLEKVKEVGYYVNGQKKYEGTLTLPCGEKYVGEFKDGKPNGQGTFTFSDGRKGVGEFRNDRPWDIIDYDKNGKIIGRYVKGEYIEKP